MNAKKLVMLLAVVAIAVGVWFMMQKPAECDCCMVPSANDETVMVMADDCECEPCEEAAAKAAEEAAAAAAAAEAAAAKAAEEAAAKAAGTPAE